MTAEQAIRDAAARREALRHYAAAHEKFAELEQTLTSRGSPVCAEGAHVYALIALRAWVLENDDPEPPGLEH